MSELSDVTPSLGVADVPDLTVALVRELIATQMPSWAHLPVAEVPRQGWDNRTFRLGEELSVRLPAAARYVPGVAKEERWLTVLAQHLPVAVPAPIALGRPAPTYPFPWSVRRWLPGHSLDVAREVDECRLAADLGRFLHALWAVPIGDGPVAGEHSFLRGCPPVVYDDDVRRALAHLVGSVPEEECVAVWEAAIGEPGPGGDGVWFHGDLAAGNLLVEDGTLTAVIDFGTCGVGDPECDLVIAWTWFRRDAREVFAAGVDLPGDAWRRARGWALWKVLITLARTPSVDVEQEQRRVLAAILEDPVRG